MPVRPVKINGKWRIVHDTPKGASISKSKHGKPVDGGGHASREQAMAQARAINASLHKKGKI